MKKARANSASIAGRPPLSSVGNKTIEKPQRKVSVPEKTATNRQKQTSEKDNALSKTYMSKSHDNLASVLRRKANNAGGNIGAHRPKSVIGLQKSEENLKTMDATTHTQSVKAKTRVTPVIVTSSPSRNDKSSASGSKPLQKASSTQNINKTPTSVKRASSTQNVNRDKAGAQNVNRGDKVIRQRISAPSNILAYNAELLANFEKEKKILEGRISDLQQVSENRKTEIERHKFEIKRLKEKVKARSKEEVDKLQHENKLLKDRLLELGIPLSEQITDSEKLSLLLQHAGSTCSGGRDSDVSPGKNNQGHYDGETDSEVSVDLTCVTPEHPSSLSFDNNSCWERQSNKSLDALSEVSVACLQDRISQMEETHYSTSEELQATLQELGDLQSAVNELTSENEHLASERGVLLESLCAQTEKLENARIQIDHLKLLLIGDTTNNVNKCDRERQLIELVKSAHVERDEIVLRQQELNNSLQSLEKENSETFDIIVALKDKIRLLEDKNESILVDKKVAEDSCRETRELLDAEKIELQRYKSLLENEKGKVEKLEQFQKTQDQSEVAKLLEKTRQEKDRLEVVIADVRESLALSQCETTRFKENLNTLEQEMKVIKNNARTSVSDMEFKLEKMSTEKMSVLTETETLREQIEQLEQELDECLEEKKTYQDSQKDTQAQLDIMQQRCAEVEREMADLKAQHETESSEWIQFQSDLQKAVVIANDIKMETQEDMEETLNENLLLKEKVASYQQELQKVSNELEKLKASDDVKENQAESPSISVSSREIRGRVLTSVDRELTNLRQTRNTTGNNQQSISVKNLIKSIEQQVKNSHVCTSPPAADTSRRSSAETPITKTLSTITDETTETPSEQNETSRRRSSAPPEIHLKSALKRTPDTSNKENITHTPTNRGHPLTALLYDKPVTDDAKASNTCTPTIIESPTSRPAELIPDSTSASTLSTNILGTSSILSSRKNSISELEKKDPLVTLVKQTGGSKRNALLKWCQHKTAKYKGIDITNFSSSWNDGLAFCALLHTYLPDKIPYDDLTSVDKKQNFMIAFRAAESVGIQATLSITDMATTERPDWQAVMGYVTLIYKTFEC